MVKFWDSDSFSVRIPLKNVDPGGGKVFLINNKFYSQICIYQCAFESMDQWGTWNSEELQDQVFYWFYKIYFSTFLILTLKINPIWLTHQSKALTKKKIWLKYFKILWKTDKVNFISSNTVCIYTHYIILSKYKFLFVCFPQNFQIFYSKFFLCQNWKSWLSIDGLII